MIRILLEKLFHLIVENLVYISSICRRNLPVVARKQIIDFMIKVDFHCSKCAEPEWKSWEMTLIEKENIWHGDKYVPYARHYNPRFVYFYPIFHCGLYCRAVSVTDNLCTKQGNSSIFGLKIRSLYSKAVNIMYRQFMH